MPKKCLCCGQAHDGPYLICSKCMGLEMAQEVRIEQAGPYIPSEDTQDLPEDEKQDICDHTQWLLEQQYAE